MDLVGKRRETALKGEGVWRRKGGKVRAAREMWVCTGDVTLNVCFYIDIR